MSASSQRQRHFNTHAPPRNELSQPSPTPSYSFSLAPESRELESGQRIRAEPPAAARYCLRWAADEELEVPAGTEFSIGRAAECLLRLSSELVSRRHARFRYASEGPVIEDLGSLNGVTVNNHTIAVPTLLQHGDTIGIGDEQIKLVDVDVVEASARQSTLRVGPRPARSESGPPPSLAALTERERDVFALMVQGYGPAEMAERLQLSLATIERHRSRVAKRLACRNRAELVTYAICAGLLKKL